jgi:hypothetical protein
MPAEDSRPFQLPAFVATPQAATALFAPHSLKLQINATIRSTIPTPAGTVVLASEASIGAVEFTKKDSATWEAKAPLRGSIRYEQAPFPLPDCPIAASEAGTAYLTATIEKRGDASVWVVRRDRDRSTSSITTSACAASVPVDVAGGGIGGAMLAVIGDIVIPIDGGMIPVHTTVPGSTDTLDATITATVTKG